MEVAKYCDIGDRSSNEDFVLEVNSEEGGLFIVADGLGGHQNGDIASKCVAETMRDFFLKGFTLDEEYMLNMFNEAQCKLLSLSERYKADMRTTVVALLVYDNKAIWGNIGDSRLYYIKKRKISSITPDHSVAYISYLNKEIDYDEIKDSPDQNVLIRSMGKEDRYKPEISSLIEIEEGDSFLLCSDGFWEYISRDEILKTNIKSDSSLRWLAKMIRIIKKNSFNLKNKDNCSAITIFV